MASNLFQKLELEAFRKGITPRTKESRDWFRKRAASLNGNSINRQKLIKEEPLERRNKINTSNPATIGSMFMFFYDPKHKETLPYYDKFPLIFVVGPAPGGFYGLNVHYLPPILRARLLDNLLDITNNKSYDETMRIKLSYDLLNASQKYKYFKPCFKHYLTPNVKSHFAYVPPSEWEVALFLPTAQWQKASPNKVYRETRDKLK